MRRSTDFFNNLQAKSCEQCGEIILEQADCYSCTCSKCDRFQAHKDLTRTDWDSYDTL